MLSYDVNGNVYVVDNVVVVVDDILLLLLMMMMITITIIMMRYSYHIVRLNYIPCFLHSLTHPSSSIPTGQS